MKNKSNVFKLYIAKHLTKSFNHSGPQEYLRNGSRDQNWGYYEYFEKENSLSV